MAVNKTNIIIKETEGELSSELCKLIGLIANKSIDEDGDFKIGVSGGSVISFLHRGLKTLETDWSRWFLFFCDECVIIENNVKSLFEIYTDMIKELGLPIPESNIMKVDVNRPASEAAKDYICKLAFHFPPDSVPVFHCLILGIGPDGHVCSLFPNHDLLNETSVWVAPITDAPKSPMSRITFTFPVINNAKNCIFALSGLHKAHIVKQVFEKNDLPASKVKPRNGNLIWIMDKNAASLL